MPQVFISYSHRDKQVARLIAQKLEARDVGVWIDEQDLKPGADIASSIRAGLEHSDTIVLILGAAEYGDSWAKREAALALSQKHKRLIPVLASRDADVPYIIRHLNQVDLSDPARAEASAEKLALFLSQPWDGAEGIGSARSDTAQVVTEALHEEIVAYAADRATANIRIIAGATATAIWWAS